MTLLKTKGYIEIPRLLEVKSRPGKEVCQIEGAKVFRDPVAWEMRMYCLQNRISFNMVAAATSIKKHRVYGILGGWARMESVEYGELAKALDKPMEFFLPHNS